MTTLVIGAGITGLALGRALAERGQAVQLVEKSKGLGGRMATRRTDSGKFDHGAQFYSLKPAMQTLHQNWVKAGLVRLWFVNEGVERFAAPGGLTSLAKNLGEGLPIGLEKKVIWLEKKSGGWISHFEDGSANHAERIVLTAPLPQSLELLRASQIEIAADLQILYAKALVGLFEGCTPFAPYQENVGHGIFSLSSQGSKGMIAKGEGLTVVMNPEFSEEYFDSEEAFPKIEEAVRELFPGFTFTKSQLKKWRYSHPTSRHASLFISPAPGLFLAGDAFGGPSINGAIASANALAEILT